MPSQLAPAHALTAAECLAASDVSVERGLDEARVLQLRELHGPNVLDTLSASAEADSNASCANAPSASRVRVSACARL